MTMKHTQSLLQNRGLLSRGKDVPTALSQSRGERALLTLKPSWPSCLRGLGKPHEKKATA